MPFNKQEYAFLLEDDVNEVAMGNTTSAVEKMGELLEMDVNDVAEQDAGFFIIAHIQAALLHYMLMAKDPASKEASKAAQDKHMAVAERFIGHADYRSQTALIGHHRFVQSTLLRSRGKFTEACNSAEESLVFYKLIRDNERNIETPPAILAHVYCELGLDLIRAGNDDKACKIFEAAAKLESEDDKTPRPSELLGAIAGSYERNNGHFAYRYRVNFAQLLVKRGDFEKAKDVLLEKWDEMNRDESDLVLAYRFNVMAEARCGLQDFQGGLEDGLLALAHLVKAQGSDKAKNNWNYLRGQLVVAQAQLGLGYPEKAESSLAEAKITLRNLGYGPEHDFTKCFIDLNRAVKEAKGITPYVTP